MNYTSDKGIWYSDILYAENYFSSTGYYLDYTDVTNGIADTLATTPLIGYYLDVANAGFNGHFALVTGKGKSVYQKIMWMTFYTHWDITNTWFDKNSTSNGYLDCKYWIDNQYIMFGFVLKDPQGKVVPLI